jgi:hypothetical protein
MEEEQKETDKGVERLGVTGDMFEEVGVGFLTPILSPMYSFPGKTPGTR